VPLDRVVTAVADELERQQTALLAEATERRDAHTVDVATLDDAREAAATGWARIAWDVVGPEGEAELAQGGVSVRCLRRADGSLPESDDERGLVAVVARSY
jgi:prolyl-tRNA synthetase